VYAEEDRPKKQKVDLLISALEFMLRISRIDSPNRRRDFAPGRKALVFDRL